MIHQYPPPASSIQHNVVLHSNINEPPTINRLEDEKPSVKQRQTNSLMTVYEQGSSNDLLTDESWHLRSPTSISDVTHHRTTDDKQVV